MDWAIHAPLLCLGICAIKLWVGRERGAVVDDDALEVDQ